MRNINDIMSRMTGCKQTDFENAFISIETSKLRQIVENYLVYKLKSYFDERKYLDANEDVKHSVERGEFNSGLTHYAKYGIYENREIYFSNFDEDAYLEQNLDVKMLVEKGNESIKAGNESIKAHACYEGIFEHRHFQPFGSWVNND